MDLKPITTEERLYVQKASPDWRSSPSAILGRAVDFDLSIYKQRFKWAVEEGTKTQEEADSFINSMEDVMVESALTQDPKYRDEAQSRLRRNGISPGDPEWAVEMGGIATIPLKELAERGVDVKGVKARLAKAMVDKTATEKQIKLLALIRRHEKSQQRGR